MLLRVRSESGPHLSHQHEANVVGRLVAQEVAPEMCLSSYVPVVDEHVPGVANKLADQLSRKYQRDATPSSLEVFEDLIEVKVPVRTPTYYPAHACVV